MNRPSISLPKHAARFELRVIAALALLFATALLPALANARKEIRDGVRRAHGASIKHAIEMFFNNHEAYPAPPVRDRLPRCASSGKEDDWLFGRDGPLSREKFLTNLPRDPRFPRKRFIQYCVTEVDDRGATSWYLRMQLERRQRPRAAFNAETGHNFYYRVVAEDGAIFFDICGGTLRCGVPPGAAGAPP